MTSDILNNEGVDPPCSRAVAAGRSPCLTCQHRDMDKNKCSMLCLRLAAYNSGEPWEGKPLPYITKGNQASPRVAQALAPRVASLVREEIVEMEETEIGNRKSEVGDQGQEKNENSPPGRGGREAGGVCKSSDKQQTMCVICHDPDKTVLNKRSQTCGACYQAWNTGKITHPTLGKFTPSLTKSKITKTKKPEIRSQKSEVKKVKAIKKAPPQKRRTVIPAEVGIQMPKNVLCVYADGLIINLDKFPKIKTAVYDTAEKYFVTPEHVVIDLLGEALAGRNQR